jgi:DNA-binding CsgD family transcriptional regulator
VSSVVGRDAELDLGLAFLSQRRGFAGLAIVGDPGIGKTTVWEALVGRAREAGSTVLVARPARAEVELSFAALGDALAEIPIEVYDALTPPQRRALDIALLRAEQEGPAPAQRTIATAVLAAVRHLARDGELVLAIDDVQWLDRESLAAFEFALRRLDDEPVRLIVSVRPQEESDSLVARLPRERLERVELGPVSLAALHRILADRLDRVFPRPVLVRIAQASGGNPLYALEIARMIGTATVAADAVPVPGDVLSLVARRVRSLPRRTQNALLRAAASARPDLTLVDAEALGPAEEAALVRVSGSDGRIEFVHPLFASAVYASASAARRQETHRELAPLVKDLEERARHLGLSCVGPDGDAALGAEQAAQSARARGASQRAVELWELALRLTPPTSHELAERRLGLGEALVLAGDFGQATAVLRELEAESDGDLRARALLQLCDVVGWHSGESAAMALAEQAFESATDPLLQARAKALVAMQAGTRDAAHASSAAREALALLEGREETAPALLAFALAARVRADLFRGDGLDREAAERALELERPAPPAAVDTRMPFKHSQWLRYVDDLERARALLREAESAAREEGDESSLPNILLNRVLAELWAGEWQTAETLADETRDLLVQAGATANTAGIWKSLVDAHRGRIAEVREAVAAAGEPVEPVVRMLWARTLGLVELSAGHADAANDQLSAAIRLLEEMRFREPAVWRVDADAIEAAVAVGDIERADTMTARLEESAIRSRIPWTRAIGARCRGLVLAARGDLDAALISLERSLVEHDACPVPFERARTLLVFGRVLRRSKAKRRAREALEEAHSLFTRLGAELWLKGTADELRRVAGHTPPRHLTVTELRIARLAANGRTNAEIAAEAFVTIKTVEANLSRAYRKLGIRSRAQLGRALDQGVDAANS